MRPAEVIAGDLLTLVASVLYVVATLRGSARPEIVSWGSWAALLTESTIAAFITGQFPSALYTGLCAAACVVVTAVSLRRGNWAVSALDIGSMAAVAVGLVLLVVVRSMSATVLVSVVADFAAYLPTMQHAWDKPDEEPAWAYFFFTAGAAFTLSAETWMVTGVAYPLYLAGADALVTGFIVFRRWEERASIARVLRPGTSIR